MKILLTGSSGFVGVNLLPRLAGSSVRCVSRNAEANRYRITGITGQTDWSDALDDCDVVIHCAARVHIMSDESADPLQAFREINVDGTANLARQAAAAGVNRFIFLSTIKVNGEFSSLDKPFLPVDNPNPESAYALSKSEAEQELKKTCADSGMEYVIVRPPLVYGPGVKANFLSMLKWVSRGVLLPLGGIRHNKRSLAYVENLVDLIKICIEHPDAANQTFLVSDDEDISTRELLERVAKALGINRRLLPIPPSWLGFAGKLLGKKDIEQRLCGSLQVDIEYTKRTLGWTPPFSMEEGLRRTAHWYRGN